MSDSSTRTNKVALRAQLSQRRHRRPATDRSAASARLNELISTYRVPLADMTIAAYVPIGDEPGDGELLDALREVAARVLLPITRSRVEPLLWGEYDGYSSLEAGPFGLRQPRQATCKLSEARWVLIPALALAPDGRRLGRGAGHYDRALGAVPRVRRIGVVYEDEVRADLPHEPHDLAVGWICTPEGIVRTLRSRAGGNAIGGTGVIGDG
ncbi:MAG: 5-formyltetrahydrofolate cyclo-ligase [Antricoccus sp.]